MTLAQVRSVTFCEENFGLSHGGGGGGGTCVTYFAEEGLFWQEISALGVFFNFDNERMRPLNTQVPPPPPPPGF